MPTESLTETIIVGKRCQIVIPKALRTQLGVHEGDQLEARTTPGGDLLLTPVSTDRPARLRSVFSRYFGGFDPVQFQRGQRDEWPA